MYQCDICKRTDETPMTWFTEEELFLCESCGSQLHTCRGCTSRQNCEFETNPQQIPPFIIKTFQQGQAVMKTQVVNPQMIETYCVKCQCYIGETCCRRTIGYCNNWSLHEEYKRSENNAGDTEFNKENG